MKKFIFQDLRKNYPLSLRHITKSKLYSTVFCFLFICICMIAGCNPKQNFVSTTKTEQTTTISKTEQTAETPKTEQPAVASKTLGKVSHQYRAVGCATVIVLNDPSKPSVLIPKNSLPKDIDMDGLEIFFNYRTLRMPQPAGCAKGIPAELTDIEKK